MMTTINGVKYYSIDHCLGIIRMYIFHMKQIDVRPSVNMNNPKEVKLFLKATNISIYWLENIYAR